MFPAMGSKRLDAISDYHRHGFRLRIDCRACGRVAIVDPLEIVEQCRARGWSRQMPAIERRLRCSRCGGREVRLGPAFGS
jgi:hypothetical protein